MCTDMIQLRSLKEDSMQYWQNLDLDDFLGAEVDLDAVLGKLNSKCGTKFNLGAVVGDIRAELIDEESNCSALAPNGQWTPCTLSAGELDFVSGGEGPVGDGPVVVLVTISGPPVVTVGGPPDPIVAVLIMNSPIDL